MTKPILYIFSKHYLRRFIILRRLNQLIKKTLQLLSGKGEADDYWGRRHLDDSYWESGIHWGQVPEVAAYINESVSGNPQIDYLQYMNYKYLKPLRKKKGEIKMLSLCCGTGTLERQLVRSKIVDYIDAFDSSPACIDKATADTKKEHLSQAISFYQQDLNKFQPIDSIRYQVIFNEAALHHISELENLLARLYNILDDDGWFICHDYIGPNQHQWTKRQLRLINDILALLPDDLKRSRTNPNVVHKFKQALTLSEMNEIDPTEGIRSEDILPIFSKYFDIVEKKDFGGTILHILLNDIAGNFYEEQHRPLIKMFIYLEKELINNGYLKSDFSFFVGKKKMKSIMI